MTCNDCFHRSVCYRVDSVPIAYAQKCGDFVSDKALEQDILDKIRAEIAEYKDDKIIHAEQNEMIEIMLDIIDKYKAESEV